ncbi:(deoxy)nucleoside triphosphate pyrophosphohydrolase, partial [Bacillus cereus]|nr:(deoxy)nucleoside triphosphate pyrophosphohydrolase [Bacillus cereus]
FSKPYIDVDVGEQEQFKIILDIADTAESIRGDRLKTIKVSAGVIIDKDKVLITRRASKENFAGGWEFPGGKLESCETPQECVARELKEELNIDVAVGDFCTEVTHNYEAFSVNLIAYYCTMVKGEISLSVLDGYKWIKIKDLLEYDLLPADVPIAEKVVEDYK